MKINGFWAQVPLREQVERLLVRLEMDVAVELHMVARVAKPVVD
jgi:hypothetical protein